MTKVVPTSLLIQRAYTVCILFLLFIFLVFVSNQSFAQSKKNSLFNDVPDLSPSDATSSDAFSKDYTNETIVIGAGQTYGLMNLIAASVCDLINDTREKEIKAKQNVSLPLCLLRSGGKSKENIESLRRGEVTLSMVQGDWQYHAFNSTSYYLDVPEFTSMRTVVAFNTKDLTLLGGINSDAQKFFDIRTLTLGVGTQESGIENLLKIVGAVLGWGKNDYGELKHMPPQKQIQALCNGEIAVGLFMTPHPSMEIENKSVACKFNFLSVSKTVLNTLILEVPYLVPVRIRADDYSRLLRDAATIGLPIRLIGLDNLDEQLAYNVFKLVYENVDAISSRHVFLKNMNQDDMAILLGDLPIHSGVSRFLLEQGIDRNELEQQKFRALRL